jgi:hypothetical protein
MSGTQLVRQYDAWGTCRRVRTSGVRLTARVIPGGSLPGPLLHESDGLSGDPLQFRTDRLRLPYTYAMNNPSTMWIRWGVASIGCRVVTIGVKWPQATAATA